MTRSILAADALGARWTRIAAEHEGDSDVWLATKLYGNVALLWWDEERVLDGRWHVLDGVLREAAGARR